MPSSSPIEHAPGTVVVYPGTEKSTDASLRLLNMSYKAIASTTGVPDKTVRDICDAPFARRGTDNPKIEEKRGRNPVISPEKNEGNGENP